MSEHPFAPIEDVVAAIARGEIVVMVDDEDRENEGDLIMAAQFATPEKLAFIVRYTSGVVCAPLTEERCNELRLPLMVEQNTESQRTALVQHGRCSDRRAPVRGTNEPLWGRLPPSCECRRSNHIHQVTPRADRTIRHKVAQRRLSALCCQYL